MSGDASSWRASPSRGLDRWGKFGEAWWNKEKDPSDKEYTYFPIPQNQLNASPVLKQTTPGWE